MAPSNKLLRMYPVLPRFTLTDSTLISCDIEVINTYTRHLNQDVPIIRGDLHGEDLSTQDPGFVRVRSKGKDRRHPPCYHQLSHVLNLHLHVDLDPITPRSARVPPPFPHSAHRKDGGKTMVTRARPGMKRILALKKRKEEEEKKRLIILGAVVPPSSPTLAGWLACGTDREVVQKPAERASIYIIHGLVDR